MHAIEYLKTFEVFHRLSANEQVGLSASGCEVNRLDLDCIVPAPSRSLDDRDLCTPHCLLLLLQNEEQRDVPSKWMHSFSSAVPLSVFPTSVFDFSRFIRYKNEY